MKTYNLMVKTALICSFLLGTYSSYSQPKVVGYIYNLSNADSLDYSRLTHLNIAFENPDVNGNLSFTAIDSFLVQQAHLHNVKVLISIGGGLISENEIQRALYFDFIGKEKRAFFVQKLTQYTVAHHFDGIDVDLEGPAINKDYGDFISSLSDALKANGKLLTAALSHGNGGSNVATVTLQLFDFINIMAYDATGPWNPKISGQHASYEFAVTCLDYWLGRGVSKEKAILGVPFYGYGFGPSYNTDGYYYTDLIKKFPGAENLDQVGDTIYYNGIPTIKAKTRLGMNKGGGVMIWQLAHDANGSKSLLVAIDEVIKGKQ